MRHRVARFNLLPVVGSLLLVGACASTQSGPTQSGATRSGPTQSGATPSTVSGPSIELQDRLPVDPAITVGRLRNGLTYYIRENFIPEKRAELRLAVNAGSILEDDDQLGLAHFVEHMAFNGTRNFAKQEIVDYIESIGSRFGADLNAYTDYDETVYMLHVPTDQAAILEQSFQILEDWAHGVSFEEEEIDKERGVVIGEWRVGRGAGARIRDQQFPVLFKDSLYAERLTIGKKEVLESFAPEVLRRFYRDWYRPDLMAVVAVGDFDARRIEALIKRHFSRLKAPPEPRQRRVATVPDHDETLFAIATDPELARTSVAVTYKSDPEPHVRVEDYRRSLVEAIYHRMVNDRLAERAQEADPPFLGASSFQGGFVRSKEVYSLQAAVEDHKLEPGLEAILTEAERVRRHGFQASELERQKADVLRSYARAYEERDKTHSRAYAAEYLRNFFEAESLPGIAYEFRLAQKYLPGITVEEVNAVGQGWITDRNRVILLSAPQRDDLELPQEDALLAVFDRVGDKAIEPYVDEVADQPLMARVPQPRPVEDRVEIEALGVTQWQLENGIRVVLKPTDFKNDEVLFTSFSPGGHSLVSDEDHIAAATAASVVQLGGVGELDLIALQKLLAGKVVRVSPFIGELTEGISGGASPEDLETMFQLIHLYLTQPRSDETAFASSRTRMRGALANRDARPETAFQDTLQKILSQDHFRRRPLTVEILDEMDLAKSLDIYRQRFADTSDFTFFFVGNFDLEDMEPLVETYLGSLPSRGRVETWRDVGVDPPRGVVEETVRRGLEEKAQVRLVFTGPFDWSRQARYDLGATSSLLRIKLRESLREDLGGTYGVSVSASSSRYPDEEYTFSISFSCAPEKVEELTAVVFDEIEDLKQDEIDPLDLTKIKETQRRSRETALKENGFWLSALRSAYYYKADPRLILAYDELVENLTTGAIQQAALRYLDEESYVRVVLLPEAERTQAPPQDVEEDGNRGRD